MSTAEEDIEYITRDDVNIAILQEIRKIRFRARLRQLMPAVARSLVAAGVDFSKVNMAAVQEPTDAEIDAIFEDLS